MQVCLKCIQISIIYQSSQIMETSHLDTNVTVNMIVDTKLCPFLLSILSVAIPILIRFVRFQLKHYYIIPTLMLILHAFFLLLTTHVHVYPSVTTSRNCNLWASKRPEISFLVCENVESFMEGSWLKSDFSYWSQ
jgi:cytochrome bd-type quinol oxidase subunit 2